MIIYFIRVIIYANASAYQMVNYPSILLKKNQLYLIHNVDALKGLLFTVCDKSQNTYFQDCSMFGMKQT